MPESSWTLRGEKVFVADGHAADHLVLSAAAPEGVSLFVVDRGAPGLAVRPIRFIDGRRGAMLRLDGVGRRRLPVGTRRETGALALPQHAARAFHQRRQRRLVDAPVPKRGHQRGHRTFEHGAGR
jgi:hypothetical protein